MATTTVIHTRHVPSFVPVLNRVIGRLLGVGVPFGPNVLLSVRGRSSGLLRTFPVAMLELDGRHFVQGTFGETNWVRNLRANSTAVVSKGSWREEVEGVELAPDEAALVLRDALKPFISRPLLAPLVSRFFGFGRNATLEDYRIAAQDHPVFELRPATSAD